MPAGRNLLISFGPCGPAASLPFCRLPVVFGLRLQLRAAASGGGGPLASIRGIPQTRGAGRTPRRCLQALSYFPFSVGRHSLKCTETTRAAMTLTAVRVCSAAPSTPASDASQNTTPPKTQASA